MYNAQRSIDSNWDYRNKFLKSIEYLRPECPPITLAICAEPILLPQVGLVAWMSTSVIIKLSARTVCVFCVRHPFKGFTISEW